jgi:hypothetical protein
MRLDLCQLRALVLNRQDQPARRQHVSAQLARCGIPFEIIDAICCEPGFMGCALSHLKALSHPGLEPPFMVFEDDCAVTEDFQRILEVPEGADMVYLGQSTWGMHPDLPDHGTNHATVATRYDEDFLQVHNMLSAHALLYLTADMVEAARAVTQSYLLKALPFDIGLAGLQRDFLALTPNRPFFYQDGRHGGAETATRTVLQPADQTETLGC